MKRCLNIKVRARIITKESPRKFNISWQMDTQEWAKFLSYETNTKHAVSIRNLHVSWYKFSWNLHMKHPINFIGNLMVVIHSGIHIIWDLEVYTYIILKHKIWFISQCSSGSESSILSCSKAKEIVSKTNRLGSFGSSTYNPWKCLLFWLSTLIFGSFMV